MIKKLTLATFTLLFPLILLIPLMLFPAMAQTPTAEGTVAGQTQKSKIDDLKERVATKVAQMRTQVYKAVVGEIKSVDKDSFVLNTPRGEKKILVTEDTKIFRITRGKRTAASLTSLKAGERAAVVGSADPQGEFVAKIVLVKTLARNVNGVIEKIDKENFAITVKNERKGASYVIDIETTTKIRIWEKGEGLKTSGFSKLKVGDRVHVNGTKGSEENRISALRILVLPGEAAGITGETSSPSAKTPTPTPW